MGKLEGRPGAASPARIMTSRPEAKKQVCVCVCVWREREREGVREGERE